MSPNEIGTVLVTGGAGYIGSHVVLTLRAGGVAVVVIDDLSTGRRSLVPDDVPFAEGDAGDGRLVRELLEAHRCKAVMHFAGSIVAPESVDAPLDYYANNTCASRTLIETCVATGIDVFLFSSSAAVYGAADILPIPESAPTRPVTPYGRSKLMTEWMLADAARAHGLRFAALRYFNVAGADPSCRSGQVGPATHLIKIAAEAAVGRRPGLTIFGDDYDTPDGTCVRDYIHVTDLAEAHVLALRVLADGAESFVVNCGYGRGHSVRQVVETVGQAARRPLNVQIGSRRAGDVAALVADSREMVGRFGWRPRHDDLTEIVASAIAWERQQGAHGS